MPAAERREAIVRAATDVFARSGYRGAKVSDVAATLGVTEPVIFQNFGSKPALFAAVVERAAADVRASLGEMAVGFGSASALLEHVLTGPAHDHDGKRGPAGAGREWPSGHAGAAYGALFSDAVALAAEPEPEPAGPARDALRAIAAHLADLIERAQAEGSVRKDADPRAAAWLLLSVLSARRLRAAAMPDELEPTVAALALRAVLTA